MTNRSSRTLMALATATLITTSGIALPSGAIAQSARSVDAPPPPPPAPTATQPAKAAPDMQAVLDQLAALGGKPIETLTPAVARMQPSAADGAKQVMIKHGLSAKPDATVTTRDVPYGSDANQFARIYKPASLANAKNLPVVVYYHGGGWVITNVDTYDAAPRLLAKQLGAIVVSVEYRHAPEFKFPAQH